jgi:hypothetical protein
LLAFAARVLRNPAGRRVAISVLDALLAIAVATLAVAALDGLTSAANLRAIYLLAVLFVTIRRDEATATASGIEVDTNGQQVGAAGAHDGGVQPPPKVAGPQ